ncbi:beta-ribofuranosylaminobenzene 5'-phosphate synthase family protein [Halomicrobium salinisoli]|uniref:beta-ribofuranosylaminobenzene 5'-phosphate synthase family protein n=1 Tax=Halomicrobium salinisoli TaxID=2878391 RepID=UPI001CF05EE1|nr:beta-ribofuranosylaminobenzene 5'-phosphate synthase family protein [Halomicrobium salinisoli]
MPVEVESNSRLHFGFVNLSDAHSRLFGSVGVCIDTPSLSVTVSRSDRVESNSEVARKYARLAVDELDVPGARVVVDESVPRHRGLGSGTQFALAVYAGVAELYRRQYDVRDVSPSLGRGMRNAIGVHAFRDGGLIVDAGQPTSDLLPDDPETGEWTVPPVVVREELPERCRFVLVVPRGETGRHGVSESESMRSVLEESDAELSDRVAGIVLRELLPSVHDGDIARFGSAVERIDRLNGQWFARQQGGVRNDVAEALAETLSDADPVAGVGQSSWGPTLYVVTTESESDATVAAVERALAAHDVSADVHVARPQNRGATVRREPAL